MSDPAASLAALLAEHRGAILHRWRRTLKDVEALPGEQRAALLDELIRLFGSRGDEAARLFGEVARELAGQRFRERARLVTVERELVGLQGAIVEELFRRDGWLSGAAVVRLTEAIGEAMVGVADSFYRRQRAEWAEFREAATMETILRHLDEGVMLLEPDGTVAYATAPMARILGQSPGVLIGGHGAKMLEQLEAEDTEGRPVRAGPGLQALELRRPVGPHLMRVRSPSGESLTFEVRGVPVFSGEELRGAIVTVRDVTALAERTAALDRAYRDLTRLHAQMLRSSRDRAMRESGAALALALNNILNGLVLGLKLQRERPTPERWEHLDRDIAQGAALLGRFQDLVVARPATTPRAAIDKMAREALELVRPDLMGAATGKALTVNAELGSAPPVAMEPRALLEVLFTLLNYVRETAEQSATIRVRTAPGPTGLARLSITYPRHEAGEEEQALSLARDAATEAHGAFTTRRTDERLFEMVLDLPFAVRPIERRAARPQATRRRAERVLVVDDDASNRSAMEELLTLHGMTVQSAGTGREALDQSGRDGFDVALIDLALPDMGGWEVARHLRRQRSDLRLALVTGWEASAAKPPEPGLVDQIFHKPVDLAALIRFLGREETRE